MSSAQVIENYETEAKMRSSSVGHFFSRIGSMKYRSKSSQNPSFRPAEDTVAFSPTQSTPLIKNGTTGKERELNAENELHNSPPPKPKRHSSPFFRIIHRLSMNRKTREASSVGLDIHNQSHSVQNELNISRETVFSTSALPAAYTSGNVLSRPTVSENDLRLITVRKDQEMERSITALSVNTNGIPSDDKFNVVTRVPSYLRISCALNGYRRPYRHIDDSRRWQSTIPPKLPMSIVETRKLAFTQNNGNNMRKSMTSEEITNRNNSQMRDDISRTSAPVRQLVEHFDHLLENSWSGQIRDMGTEDSHHNESTTVLDEEHTVKPLNYPVASKNSIAFSDQLYGAAYLHTNPEPSVAHRMHQALLKTTMESEPHINNQAKITVGNVQSTNEQVAEKVKNENGINFILPDCKTYRNLLMEARTSLQLQCDRANSDLLEEDRIPEHAAGTIRTAIGKANLLLDKKMAKFEDLVISHLNQNSDAQQVTLSDLSGYWALISIELKELEANFHEISALRENHWEPKEVELPSVSISGENRGDSMKKAQYHSPIINSEKVALEVQRRQTALAAAKRRQKELMKAEEEHQCGHNNDNNCLITQ